MLKPKLVIMFCVSILVKTVGQSHDNDDFAALVEVVVVLGAGAGAGQKERLD